MGELRAALSTVLHSSVTLGRALHLAKPEFLHWKVKAPKGVIAEILSLGHLKSLKDLLENILWCGPSSAYLTSEKMPVL